MRRFAAGFLLLSLLASQAWAKLYYINQGVRYHIGDGKSAESGDAMFVGTYPLVGKQWVEGFRMDRRDRVKVNIRHLWGVDDCEYCKDLVWIDGKLMGRLDAAENKTGFATPPQLAADLDAGDHLLMIESVGMEQADDFVMEGVSVGTGEANIVLMQPGPVIKGPMDPMPKLFAPEPVGKGLCDSLVRERNWMLGWEQGQPRDLSLTSDEDPAASPLLLGLPQGSYCALQVESTGADGTGKLGQAFEILAGDQGRDGWDLQYDGGGVAHGNVVRDGDYTPESFPAPAWHPGWNLVEVQRCRDGSLSASVNGQPLGPSVDVPGASAGIRLQGLGLDLDVRPAP
ncbi:MAG TPA: hypothetical protein VK914_07495 [bacterium]|nr:hypothetical protein [bacterium]